MNLAAATLDIAVDGLAIDVLGPRDLGHGNAAQVVGYKLGMLAGGGLLLWASERIGQRACFVAMAALVFVVLLATLGFKEPPSKARPTLTIADIVNALVRALRAPGSGFLLLAVATYKLGESMSDAMFKPFVLDHGFTKGQIGLWIGTWGMVCSMAGSLVGGFAAARLPVLRALAVAAVLRIAPLAAQWWLSLQHPISADAVIAVTCSEHFFGGMLTTAMFATMMGSVDRTIGATHFTALAAVEVLGKSPAAWLSGVLAEYAGYPTLFATATLLSVAFLLTLPPLRLVLSRL
jgi:hypothetical protein